jgi:four helix bundle protein
VSSNIFEGCGKSTVSDLLQNLYYANRSIKEAENLLIVASQLRLLDEPQYEECDRLCNVQ